MTRKTKTATPKLANTKTKRAAAKRKAASATSIADNGRISISRDEYESLLSAREQGRMAVAAMSATSVSASVSASYNADPQPIKTTPPIVGALADLHESLLTLDGTISMLGDKLVSVLGPDYPVEDGKRESLPTQSGVACEIRSRAGWVQNINAVLTGLLHRIEL